MQPQRRQAKTLVPNHAALHARMVIQFVDRMTSVDTDVKLRLLLDVRERKWNDLVIAAEGLVQDALKFHASHSADTYFERAQLVALVKKYRAISPKTQSLDPEHTARATWLDCERRCRDATLRLSSLLSPDLERVIRRAKHYIWTVLGDEPDMEEIYSQCDFSSGASVGVHGDLTHIARKYTSEVWTVTLGALPFAISALRRSRWVRETLGFSELDSSCLSNAEVLQKLRIVPGNKLTFVPKTMATHRAIAVEPLLNSFVQQGVDMVMRDRLVRRCRNGLRDQTLNQEFARIGSIDGSIATIDLSSASDLISVGLVKRLLPYGWWSLLNSLRSPRTLDVKSGAWVELYKFSSMGNNFTFPLQTLIFRSLAVALGSERVRVYGDDIIVESEIAPDLARLLDVLGLQVNAKKSFWTGPFRESCGSDWWHGVRVRPTFCVKSWEDIRNIMSFHNHALKTWPARFLDLLEDLRQSFPDALVRPTDDSDGSAFNVPLDVFMTSRHARWDRAMFHWTWREFISRPVSDKRCYGPGGSRAQLLHFLKNQKVPELVFRRRTTNAVHRVGGWNLPRIQLGWLKALDRGYNPDSELFKS